MQYVKKMAQMFEIQHIAAIISSFCMYLNQHLAQNVNLGSVGVR